MTRLDWNAIGKRFYETGVDQGVLYTDSAVVAWPGLISVSESASGGDAKPFYIDGYKYLNLAAAEEFQAKIAAFSSPPEFAQCDGVSSVYPGLFATQQPRKSFNLSFRTRVGNDIDGADHGYKIHLVYNALAAPTDRSNSTITDKADPDTLNWSLTTRAPRVGDIKPTAHFVIDSRYTPAGTLAQLESILYGSDTADPYFPSAQDLLDLFAPPLSYHLVSTETNVWQLYETTDSANALTYRGSIEPIASNGPLLWLNTSNGSYAVPTLVTGG